MAIGEIPDDLCGVCMVVHGRFIAVVRAGSEYGAMFVCEGCAKLVKERMMKRPKGLPN